MELFFVSIIAEALHWKTHPGRLHIIILQIRPSKEGMRPKVKGSIIQK